MEHQKFIPEGWTDACGAITPSQLNQAFTQGDIMNRICY